MADIWRVACGTGHRSLTPAEFAWMDEELRRVIDKLQTDHGLEIVVSGMALCYDQRLAEVGKLSGCRLMAAIPFPSQDAKWTPEQQDRWHELCELADDIIVVSPTDPDFDNPRQVAAMLHGRNDAMLDISQVVIACADLKKLKWSPAGQVRGGTWSCIDKAVRRQMPIIWMDPGARTVKKPTLDGWRRIFREHKEKNHGR